MSRRSRQLSRCAGLGAGECLLPTCLPAGVLQDCCAAVVKIFRDRENLAASLKDTKTVVGKLETLIGGVIHVVFCFIYLAIFNVSPADLGSWAAGFSSPVQRSL